MKLFLKCLCIVLILALLTAGAAAEVTLNTVFQYMPVIQTVSGTSYVIVESKKDNTRGLYTTDGQEIIPCTTVYLDYLSNDFFNAYNEKDSIDARALWTGDGRMVTEAKYGAFKIFNNHWVAAFVVNPEPQAEKEFQDVRIGSSSYKYEQIDLFYVTDEQTEGIAPLATLDRDAYSGASIHGDYIAITNRENAISVYDSHFQPITVELSANNKPLYKVDKYQIISLIDKKMLGDGYTEVAEVNLSDRMLVKGTRVALNGTKLSSLMNPDGTVVLPADYAIIDVTDRYALVADLEGQQGLYDLNEGRFIVPCAYTAIVSSKTDADKYVHNGYVCVEKDERLGFYDTVNDMESCAPKYSKYAVTNIGCSLIFTSIEGYLTIVAGDGEVNVVDADVIVATRGNGYLLEAKKGASFGLVDWHGNLILPMYHYKEITVTDDSNAIIRTSTGLQLDQIIR
ncbi:MAG: hypothetical protein IKH57_19830 [Clostridia bacterium]|nr:hypothetical protein [Clostridia bacterium]